MLFFVIELDEERIEKDWLVICYLWQSFHLYFLSMVDIGVK